jgi:AP-1-like factor
LTDLQGRHSELIQSYENLRLEYLAVKHEMEVLQCKYENGSPAFRSYFSGIKEENASRAEPSDPLLYDASAFRCEPEERGQQEGQWG